MNSKRLRSKDGLLGSPANQIPGVELPSLRKVLQYAAHVKTLNVDKKFSTEDAAFVVADEVIRKWQNANIPHIEKRNITRKICKASDELKRVNKVNKNRRNVLHSNVNADTDETGTVRLNIVRKKNLENLLSTVGRVRTKENEVEEQTGADAEADEYQLPTTRAEVSRHQLQCTSDNNAMDDSEGHDDQCDGPGKPVPKPRKKHGKGRKPILLQKRTQFEVNLDSLFDIAPINVMQMIKNQNDRDFLTGMRDGLQYSFGKVDTAFVRNFKRKIAELEGKEKMRMREECEVEHTLTNRGLTEQEVLFMGADDFAHPTTSPATRASDTTTSTPCTTVGVNQELASDTEFTPPTGKAPKSKYVTLEVPRDILASPELALACDRVKGSSRGVTHITAGTLKASGANITDFYISPSTVIRKRNEVRKKIATSIYLNYTPTEFMVVHWDGKLLQQYAVKAEGKVDRHAVLLSGTDGSEKLLGVPVIDRGTGRDQADSTLFFLNQWSAVDNTVGMVFDTTSSNTGVEVGACVLMEQALQRPLLYLPCRHHIRELNLGKAWSVVTGSTKAPKVTQFEVIKNQWPTLELNTFDITPGIFEGDVEERLRDEAIDYFNDINGKWQPRDDYKELLVLCGAYLGACVILAERLKFPIAMHHARWQAKAIHAVKATLLRKDLLRLKIVTESDMKELERFSKYVVLIHFKQWFACAAKASEAAVNDIQAFKAIDTYKRVDMEVAKAVEKVMGRHTWFLCEQLVPMALFSKTLHHEAKRAIANALCAIFKLHNKPIALGKPKLPHVDATSQISSFVGSKSFLLFQLLGIDTTFLFDDVEDWTSDPRYQEGEAHVNGLKVLNDAAERAMALITNYHNVVTKDESQRQYLLQSMEFHQNVYPKATKTCLAKNLLPTL